MEEADAKLMLLSGNMVTFDPVKPHNPEIPVFATFARTGDDLPLGVPIKLFLMNENGKERINQTVMLLGRHPRLKGDGVWFSRTDDSNDMRKKSFGRSRIKEGENRIGFVILSILIVGFTEKILREWFAQHVGAETAYATMLLLGLCGYFWLQYAVQKSIGSAVSQSMKLFTDPGVGYTTISAIIAEKGPPDVKTHP